MTSRPLRWFAANNGSETGMAEKAIAVIGARLNSSRLPGKQLLPLAGVPMIEHIARRLRAVGEFDEVILATTDDSFNKPLVDWAKSSGTSFFAYSGDVDDLVGRVDTIVKNEKAELILYVCGDSPLIEPETIKNMVQALRQQPEAGCAMLETPPEGQQYIHAGFDLYRRQFWDEMVAASVEPFEREHLGVAFHRVGKVKPGEIAIVKDDPVFLSCEHRISVDTPSDYGFMGQIYSDWYGRHDKKSIVDLRWVIQHLQADDKLAAANRHVRQKGIREKSRSVLIFAEAGPKTGLGHLSRMLVLARAMLDMAAAKVHMVIVGEVPKGFDWQYVSHTVIAPDAAEYLLEDLPGPHIVITDMKSDIARFTAYFKAAQADGAMLVAVDRVVDGLQADLLVIPNFQENISEDQAIHSVSGWPYYLLPRVSRKLPNSDNVRELIVLTGGGDTKLLAQTWPSELDEKLPEDVNVTWVQWPYADAPQVPETSIRTWTVWHTKPTLAKELHRFDMALCAYGVSFFECLNAGLPTVTFDATGGISSEEWLALEKADVAMPEKMADQVITAVVQLAQHGEVRQSLSEKAFELLKNDGGATVAQAVWAEYQQKNWGLQDDNCFF